MAICRQFWENILFLSGSHYRFFTVTCLSLLPIIIIIIIFSPLLYILLISRLYFISRKRNTTVSQHIFQQRNWRARKSRVLNHYLSDHPSSSFWEHSSSVFLPSSFTLSCRPSSRDPLTYASLFIHTLPHFIL